MLAHLLDVLPAFLVASVILAALPGPATALFLHRSVRDGRKAGLAAVVGNEIGVCGWTLAGGGGLSILLAANHWLSLALHVVGAAILIWLGISAWRSHAFAPSEQQAALLSRRNLWLATRQEFLIGISNPKAILLFAAIFPQFIRTDQPATEQFLYLGTTYLLAEYVASLLYALFGLQIRRLIRTARGVRNLNRTTGAFFVGAGGLLLGASQH